MIHVTCQLLPSPIKVMLSAVIIGNMALFATAEEPVIADEPQVARFDFVAGAGVLVRIEEDVLRLHHQGAEVVFEGLEPMDVGDARCLACGVLGVLLSFPNGDQFTCLLDE